MQTKRKLLVLGGIVVIALASGVFAVVMRSSSGGGSDSVPIVLNNADYINDSRKAAEFAQEPMRKFGDGETLTSAEKADLAQAGKLYDAMYEYRPIQPGPKFVAGQICEALGDHDGAISKLNTFITGVSASQPTAKTSVNVADSHWVIADALSAEGKWQQAMDQVTISLKAYPGTCEYLITRANIEYNTGKENQAKKDVIEALAKEPDNVRGKKLASVLGVK